MKLWKFLAPLALCLALLVILPTTANAASSGTCGANVTWTLDDTGTLTISGSGPMRNYSSSLGASPQTPWYASRSSIKTVVIEDGVTAIGASAFYKCSNLTSVTIGNSVDAISYNAFSSSGLTSVTIPDSVTTIGDSAFSYCANLTCVTIGNSVTTIGDSAFSDCANLTRVTIGNSVTTIGYSAFRNCKSLTSVTIPNSVVTIDDVAFFNCDSLTSVEIPNSVTTIGAQAFGACAQLTYNTYDTGIYLGNAGNPYRVLIGTTSQYITRCAIHPNTKIIARHAFEASFFLTSVMIPTGVTTIGDYAFKYCDRLTSVEIPDSVTTIGEGAFCDCSGLTSVTIPDSVTAIGTYAFSGCAKLSGIWVDENNPNYSCDSKGVLFNKDKTTLIQAPDALAGNYAIPDSVTAISDVAFRECDSLTSVTMGNSVTTIGSSAFEECDSLTSVTIPDSVTTIGREAFYNCTSLTDVYYGGTQGQWASIQIKEYNEPLKNATIHFVELLPGDVDGNENLSTDDAVYLLLHVMFGAEDYPVPDGMILDFNGDSKVDTDDAVYLLLHVMFGEEDYPLSA